MFDAECGFHIIWAQCHYAQSGRNYFDKTSGNDWIERGGFVSRTLPEHRIYLLLIMNVMKTIYTPDNYEMNLVSLSVDILLTACIHGNDHNIEYLT